MKVLEFKESFAPYAPGDIAGIDDKLAAKLVKRGIASEFKKSVKEAAKDKMVKEPKVEK